ncbi:hypothetical protein [Chryseobacterium caseinilyticum]|uniref:Phage morphogenesis protein n=1 Tax=Chryseobacterium caseinilyticum TaxID=2771428 RepID=A0ABR8Z8D1_9FLAO|nr:hypothetical protein [Chryseobacterium caseinilyticum]MBD8081133.1 hypothetical protein [Chryseobacterium caseinilyticum]
MSLIQRRSQKQGIIEGLFIKKTLEEQAKGILGDSKRAMKGFTSAKWSKKKMVIDEDTMTYSHLADFRFVDMKTRRAKSGYNPATRKLKAGKVRKKKSFPIHNKPIMHHKRMLIRTISFGFTEEVKAQFEELAKVNNLLPENG